MKWHPGFHRFIRHLYFSRITVSGQGNVPDRGPLLVLCLHRNGAVDAFVYRGAIEGLHFMVKATLRRSFFGRIFFDGVEVTRASDGSRDGDNSEAIETCTARLRAGGRLAIFPEGTSRLGPRHLPFKSGASWIATRYLESADELNVVPVGIHYECPWAFRSRVEVVIGPAFSLPLPESRRSPGSRLAEIKQRFSAALETVGLNVPDGRHLDLAQKFAYIATLGTDIRYFAALKSFERRLPPEVVRAWGNLDAGARGRRVLRHQGVPLFPLSSGWVHALLTALLAPPVIVGALANLPPLALAFWAGRRFPDDTNVIALWRILIGVPLFLIWGATCLLGTALSGSGWLAAAYLVLTWIAIRGWYRLKKLTVIAWNGLFHPDLRADALAVHRAVLSTLQSPTHDPTIPSVISPA